ncbi:hypothetical protein L202_03828 [Cryptococcus amylolentus CBS 6039]|uniref:C2H2-type domain-containing protein n=2 Tax=Cryptococcus amylolentus CBS 6039 TaxID=1295533 RepID=A0A1E3HUE1_9TREE|nr:hypothetical protein L202_03828 [Cryptococcus amylolentus CBS 6039]ODN79952.1 hypothetical protein L202_03828 [Cryptococcus amylolentus CBS 6039]
MSPHTACSSPRTHAVSTKIAPTSSEHRSSASTITARESGNMVTATFATHHVYFDAPPLSPSNISPTSRPGASLFTTTFKHPAEPSPKGNMARRSSRADPMIRTDDEAYEEDEGYGELGQRHPLRRVKEDSKEEEEARQVSGGDAISLPGIKSLLSGAGDPPSVLNSALFQSPSLPSLVPNSPTSPSTAASGRTSRFSSLTSSAAVETSAPGWWHPDFNGNPFSAHQSYRSNALPHTQTHLFDEHDQKRRRSDGPPPAADNEELARLKWQAQSRNASFPSASPSGSSGPTTPTNWPSRASLHPPSAPYAGVSAAMSRGSLSGMSGGEGVSPPVSRRASPRSRNGSLVSGQLAKHFADLSADSPRGSLSAPSAPERRLSVHPPAFLGTERRASSLLRPLSTPDSEKPLPSSSLIIPAISRPSSAASDRLRRQSNTQPSTPDGEVRRSSLSDMIKAQSGDDVAMKEGKYLAEKSPLSEPILAAPSPLRASPQSVFLPVPSGRRESTESISSYTAHLAISQDDDRTLSGRGKKRSVEEREDVMSVGESSGSGSGDPGMRGMEVLAEEALRAAQEEEGKRSGEEEDEMDEERDSPGKGPGSGVAGPKYVCSYCAKSFSRPSSLKIHTHSHTGERPYVCHEPGCGRRFSVQSNLKRHAKVHQVGSNGVSKDTPVTTTAPAPNPGPKAIVTQDPPPHAPFQPQGHAHMVPHPHPHHSGAHPYAHGHHPMHAMPHMPPGYYFAPGYAPMPMGMAQPPPHPHQQGMVPQGYYPDPRYGMMHSPSAGMGPEGFGQPVGMPQPAQYGHYAEQPPSQAQAPPQEVKGSRRMGSLVKGGKKRRSRGTDGGIKEEEEE